jgi:hypothetical protein
LSSIISTLTFLLSFQVSAQTARKLTIQSTHDKYDLILMSRTKGSVDGKPASLRSFDELWPVLNNSLGNECPTLKGSPEVTVREGEKLRSIYVKQGIVTDGKACMNVGGEGLYYFPVHRDFLIGSHEDSILLKSPVKIFRQGIKLLEFRKDGEQWVSDNKDMLVNWDFIERFENSLRDFNVRLRVHPDIAKGKTKMIVQSGPQTYEFYKVTSVMWAVKKPGFPWLIASDDWSFWYDFDQKQIEDRYAGEIRFITKADTGKDDKKATLERLEGLWSRNLRDLYHKFLLNPDEDLELQELALKRLRSKPSPETSQVLAQFVNESRDKDLKAMAAEILKKHDPKGRTKKVQ